MNDNDMPPKLMDLMWERFDRSMTALCEDVCVRFLGLPFYENEEHFGTLPDGNGDSVAI